MFPGLVISCIKCPFLLLLALVNKASELSAREVDNFMPFKLIGSLEDLSRRFTSWIEANKVVHGGVTSGHQQ